jgi:hypothetical protein
VLIGLIRADGGSWMEVDPDWQPSPPRSGDGFALADLLTFSEVERGASS